MKKTALMLVAGAIALSLPACSSVSDTPSSWTEYARKEFKNYFGMNVEYKDDRWIRNDGPTTDDLFYYDWLFMCCSRMSEAGIAPLTRERWIKLRIITFWGDEKTGVALYHHSWYEDGDIRDIRAAMDEFPTSGNFDYAWWLVELASKDHHRVALWSRSDMSNDRLKRIIRKYAKDPVAEEAR